MADPLYSRSSRNLLDQAVRIAREVARRDLPQIVLGARHLMAAYAFRNPSDHVDQVRGWGFDAEAWRSAFKDFAVGFDQIHDEDWSKLGHAAVSSAPVIGSFTADDPLATPRDLLGIEDEAAAFARIISARDVKPPLAIGVFGEWGSGKTFFMRRIHDSVQALEAAERALAEAEARLNEARSDFESASARSRLNAFIRAKATDGDYAKHLGIIAAVRRDFGQLTSLMGLANDGKEQLEESQRLAEEMHGGVVRFLDRMATEPDVRLTEGEVRSLLKLLEPAQALELVAARHKQLAECLESEDALKTLEDELRSTRAEPLPKFSRIVLYIDDLDRCLPQVVVDVLQAVHLLLCFPLFTVVVAVDARWVSRALHDQFPKLLGETGRFAGGGRASLGAGASSHDYLEKIFQIPYWVRPVDVDGATRYVSTLVEPDVRRIAVAVQTPDDAAGAASIGANAQDVVSLPTAYDGPGGNASSRMPLSPASAAPSAAAVGLELTRWEADALERFAPLISGTPRRLIRFVNLYRLLKTGLASDTRQRLVGERGESDVYRALVLQLAIVTGAPSAAPVYFRVLETMKDDDVLSAVCERVQNDGALKQARDRDVVMRVLASARDWPGTALCVEDLRLIAPTARRYSFTAWSG